MSLKPLIAILKELTSSFLDKNIEVLKDLILLSKEGKNRDELKSILVQKNKYNNKQINTLLDWVVQFRNNPKELEYLFSDRAVTQNNSISPASVKTFIKELEQGFLSLEGKDLKDQRLQLKHISLSVTRMKVIVDSLYHV